MFIMQIHLRTVREHAGSGGAIPRLPRFQLQDVLGDEGEGAGCPASRSPLVALPDCHVEHCRCTWLHVDCGSHFVICAELALGPNSCGRPRRACMCGVAHKRWPLQSSRPGKMMRRVVLALHGCLH